MKKINIEEFEHLEMYVGKKIGVYSTHRKNSNDDFTSNIRVIFIGILEKLFDRRNKTMRGYAIKGSMYELFESDYGDSWVLSPDRYVSAVTHDDFGARKPSFILEEDV